MSTRSQRIEQIFQRVEEESERRAQQATRGSTVFTASTVSGRRRGGSISVSRFGQPVEPSDVSTGPPSTPPPTMSSYVVRGPTFYQVQPHLHMGSADSLASTEIGDDDHDTDEALTTHVATIAGRQSISRAVGGMLSRKLSRSRRHSKDVIPLSSSNVVIGVSVEEATVEAEAHESAHHEPATSVAYSSASSALRHQRSMAVEKSSANNWVDKAKGVTQKLRRKSVAALSLSPDR
ncbi:predicted protein [Sparassis crispa]|uniref:Uncharacterized protein n=1 Tax=Sparassis crispa TaxID=139825 RepID=A0A401GFA5_9APHY|nr:predicted protein [Sparassis crispa]GBE80850.1 predicted protein [Sparassis crispa]